MITLYRKVLNELENAFFTLESEIEKPEWQKFGLHHVFRYSNQSTEAAMIQKLARVISGLNASLCLLNGGFVQELGALFRILDEFNEDILFLCQEVLRGKKSSLLKEYLDSFYQEEFDQPNNPFNSTQKRPIILRKKIMAAISNIPENELNASDHKECLRTISKAYSGYVHGASCHIMEMYGGNPPHYHVSGMINTPQINEFCNDLYNYIYRGLHSVLLTSIAFKNEKIKVKLINLRDEFETKVGRAKDNPEKLVKMIKCKRSE